jgi:hypothetical protein
VPYNVRYLAKRWDNPCLCANVRIWDQPTAKAMAALLFAGRSLLGTSDCGLGPVTRPQTLNSFAVRPRRHRTPEADVRMNDSVGALSMPLGSRSFIENPYAR